MTERIYSHGGVRNPNAKLTAQRVAIIRAVPHYGFDVRGWQSKLATAWGVDSASICRAASGRTWPDVVAVPWPVGGQPETIWDLISLMDGL